MNKEQRPDIAILASGSGTTAEAFIHASQAGIVKANVSLVIASKEDAGIFDRVERLNQQYQLGIKALHISSSTHPDNPGAPGEQTLAESTAIRDEVAKRNITLVALMGYMKKVRGPLLEDYGALPGHASILQARMLNTHPGPLPETQGMVGKGAQAWVLRAGLGYSAQTLHAVAEEYDTGAIFAEHRVAVLPHDTPESLFDSVQLAEKTYLPVDIGRFLTKQQAYNAGRSAAAKA